jgi:hypothetical protein
MLRRFLLAGLMIGGALLGAPSSFEVQAQTPSAVSSISVEGTEIVVKLANDRVLRSKELVGATLDVRFEGQPAKVRIAGIELDPGDKSKTVWLHTMETRQADGTWQNLCSPGPDGSQQGFPLQDAKGSLELTCSSGALGKCVRFGYRPWANGPDGTSLGPQHAACVRMVRGDYGGSNGPFTKNGMSIDLYDAQGIQNADNAPDQTFEAGWTPEGAVCVHHVRVKENVTLAALEEKFPRLKGRTGAICTEEFARSLGALVFNRSKP